MSSGIAGERETVTTAPLRVSYVTTYDPCDVRAWSGIGHAMAVAVREAGADVQLVGPLRTPLTAGRVVAAVANRIGARAVFQRDREASVARSYARQTARRVGAGCDVVFSPGTIPIAFLDQATPVAFWTDATFRQLLDFYPDYSGLSRHTIRAGERLEKRALERCSAAFYSSDWAARSAREDYGADPAKLHVVPFGANIETPGEQTVRDALERRTLEPVRIVFIGEDWDRKGGIMALDVLAELRGRGVDARLTIIGPSPVAEQPSEAIEPLGYLDKRLARDRELFGRTLLQAHLLLLPSSADCTPVAICEAFAHGVPVVASDVGGIMSLVTHGVSGKVLDPLAEPRDYADAVLALVSNRASYERAALAARLDHIERLNWATSATSVLRVLDALTIRRSAGGRTLRR
jgi:glycosyltransferase involved in cell wall biosynthesis